MKLVTEFAIATHVALPLALAPIVAVPVTVVQRATDGLPAVTTTATRIPVLRSSGVDPQVDVRLVVVPAEVVALSLRTSAIQVRHVETVLVQTLLAVVVLVTNPTTTAAVALQLRTSTFQAIAPRTTTVDNGLSLTTWLADIGRSTLTTKEVQAVETFRGSFTSPSST